MDSGEDEVESVPVTSTPSTLPLAARSVIQTIANIRKNPSLRQGFVSGNRDILGEAVSEVRDTFQPKRRGRPPKPKEHAIRKSKKSYFKHVIACLPSPDVTHNPSRQEWNKLHDRGLGKLWKGYAAACIPSRLCPKEFHSLLLSMYPALVSTPYELCKLGGAYNNEVIVLQNDENPAAVFHPNWTPEKLRHVIGTKAQLIIKPQVAISSEAIRNAPSVSCRHYAH